MRVIPKTTNQGFLEAYQQFPAYQEIPAHPEKSSPQGEGENVSHVSDTPPGSPSPDSNKTTTSQRETTGTKILNKIMMIKVSAKKLR